MTNAIRLTRAQRATLNVEEGARVLMRSRDGNSYSAIVKLARRHEMARGAHRDGYAPCDIYKGPSPKPKRAKLTRVVAARSDADHDCGAHMDNDVYAKLVDQERMFRAQNLTTFGNFFEFAFANSPSPDDPNVDRDPDDLTRHGQGRAMPIKSTRSNAAYERLRGASDVDNVVRVYDDTCDTWRVSGCVTTATG